MAVNTRLRRLMAFLVAAGVVTILGIGCEALLFGRGDNKLAVLFFSNAVTGVIAGALYLQSRLREWEKQQVLQDRLKKIADMNHHVRNALAVVQFYGTQRGDRYATEAVAHDCSVVFLAESREVVGRNQCPGHLFGAFYPSP